MHFYFYAIFIAGMLPYAATIIAKSKPGFDNANPRAWLAKQEGFRARAHAAQLNSFESFPFFAAGVIVAHIKGANPHTIDILAGVYLAMRVAYLATYLANLATLRSIVWFVGIGSIAWLFFAS